MHQLEVTDFDKNAVINELLESVPDTIDIGIHSTRTQSKTEVRLQPRTLSVPSDLQNRINALMRIEVERRQVIAEKFIKLPVFCSELIFKINEKKWGTLLTPNFDYSKVHSLENRIGALTPQSIK